MNNDKQEEIVILFELFQRGGKASKARVTTNIIGNGYLKPRPQDHTTRQGRETILENDLAWARENLREKGDLAMPEWGVWQITEKGKERLLRVSKAIYEKKPDATWFERYSQKFLDCASAFGERLSASSTLAVTN